LDQSITLTLQDSLGSFEPQGPFLFSSSFCLPFQELGINGGSTRSHATRGHIKNYLSIENSKWDCSQFLSINFFCYFDNFFPPPRPLILKREQKHQKKLLHKSGANSGVKFVERVQE
jgi:hypothetical protein